MARDDATRVALLHPGNMGASIGGALAGAGHDVVWCAEGRSPATAERADSAGLRRAGDLQTAVVDADVVLSLCPPAAARAVAVSVVAAGFGGVYVDANAVDPVTAQEIGSLVAEAGCGFVDGSVIGPPAHRAGTTRLYLSGAAASQVAALFDLTLVDARVVEGPAGSASALKVAYAAWTKGSGALLLAARAYARAAGVEGDLLDEWALSIPELIERSEASAPSAAAKGWRFAGEMEEIAAAFGRTALPEGFHRAASEIFRRLAPLRGQDPASLDMVLAAILGDPAGPPVSEDAGQS